MNGMGRREKTNKTAGFLLEGEEATFPRSLSRPFFFS